MLKQNSKDKSIDTLLNEDIYTWGLSLSNELGRLSQGNGKVIGNNALIFIKSQKYHMGRRWHMPNWCVTIGQSKKKNSESD